MTNAKRVGFIFLTATTVLLLLGTVMLTAFLYRENETRLKENDALRGEVSALEERLGSSLQDTVDRSVENALDSAVEDAVADAFSPFQNEDELTVEEPPPGEDALPYLSAYPDLYAEYDADECDEPGVIYLTFDDGPSTNTATILDILKAHNVQATFFVVTGDTLPDWKAELLRRIVDEGHTIGVHSASHQYKTIYASVDAYLADFNTAYTQVYEATGVRPWAFRFPGGSINAYNRGTYQEIIAEMSRRGFVYYDWNCSAQDASKTATAAGIWSNMLRNISTSHRNILLLHDTKRLTVNQLDKFITRMEAEGHTFAALTPEVEAVYFAYKDNGGTRE